MALVDAASFLVAAAVISTIQVEEETPEHEEAAYWSQLTDGLRHLVHDRVLGHLLIGFGISMLVLGFTESAIFARAALVTFTSRPQRSFGVQPYSFR